MFQLGLGHFIQWWTHGQLHLFSVKCHIYHPYLGMAYMVFLIKLSVFVIARLCWLWDNYRTGVSVSTRYGLNPNVYGVSIFIWRILWYLLDWSFVFSDIYWASSLFSLTFIGLVFFSNKANINSLIAAGTLRNRYDICQMKDYIFRMMLWLWRWILRWCSPLSREKKIV